MRRAVARFGDSTTTGGKVFAFSAEMYDNGRKLALSGETASCGNCSGAYPIFGTGEQMTEHGRSVVLHGDSVLCPCEKNKVFVSDDAGIHVDCDGSDKASSKPNSSLSHAALALINFDEKFTLVDAFTRAPIKGMAYRLVSDGDVIGTGITDSEGRTERIATNSAQKVMLQIRSINV